MKLPDSTIAGTINLLFFIHASFGFGKFVAPKVENNARSSHELMFGDVSNEVSGARLAEAADYFATFLTPFTPRDLFCALLFPVLPVHPSRRLNLNLTSIRKFTDFREGHVQASRFNSSRLHGLTPKTIGSKLDGNGNFETIALRGKRCRA
jgi:hypothetical protein